MSFVFFTNEKILHLKADEMVKKQISWINIQGQFAQHKLQLEEETLYSLCAVDLCRPSGTLSGSFPSLNHCLATVATRMNAACLWSALNGQFTAEKKDLNTDRIGDLQIYVKQHFEKYKIYNYYFIILLQQKIVLVIFSSLKKCI